MTMTPEEAEATAQVIEYLFADLEELRELSADEVGARTHIAGARVALLNLLDLATEHNLFGTTLSDMPEEHEAEQWEWTETQTLVRAMNHGFGALVRDLAFLRSGVGGGGGRELDVRRFRMTWETLSRRQIQSDGATIIVQDGEGGEVGVRVHFEPPMANPFKEDAATDPDELTGAQILVGNMMAYAFKRRNQE